MRDGDGNVVATVNPDGNTTTTLYDAADQVTGTIDARGFLTKETLDGDGNAVTQTDADGNVTTSLYDGNDNLTGTD